jgi:hypothetical protein
MSTTGCTIQEILGSDTPNQGRIKINENFDCVVSAITNTIEFDTYVTGGTYNTFTESIDFSGTTLFTPFSVDVSDLLDDTNTFTTGVTLNGTVLEFDRNDTLNAYGVELSGLTSSLITGQTLSETLTIGNETSGNNIEMTTGDAIVAANGNTINLDVTLGPFTDSVVITDAVGSGLGIIPGYGLVLTNSSYGNYVHLEDTGLVDITTAGGFLLNANDGVSLGVFGSGDISILNNGITNKTSSNINKNSVFIGTRNSTINSGVTNSVVLGGVGITATQNNTIYVPNLNIGILGTGTSINNLGIDSNGFVVSGLTSTDTNFANTDLTFTGGRTHELNGWDLVIGEGTSQTIGMFNGFATQITFDNSIWEIANNYQDFGVSGITSLSLLSTEAVFNNNGINYNFRVEGDTDQNLLFTKASTDRVGVGTNLPTEKLHVSGNTKISGTLNVGTLGTGTSVNNLGIDSNGFVVSGLTSSGPLKYTASIPFTGGTVQTITHNLSDADVIVQLKDSTGKLIIPDEINNYTSNTVDIKVSSTETYRVIIIG